MLIIKFYSSFIPRRNAPIYTKKAIFFECFADNFLHPIPRISFPHGSFSDCYRKFRILFLSIYIFKTYCSHIFICIRNKCKMNILLIIYGIINKRNTII